MIEGVAKLCKELYITKQMIRKSLSINKGTYPTKAILKFPNLNQALIYIASKGDFMVLCHFPCWLNFHGISNLIHDVFA